MSPLCCMDEVGPVRTKAVNFFNVNRLGRARQGESCGSLCCKFQPGWKTPVNAVDVYPGRWWRSMKTSCLTKGIRKLFLKRLGTPHTTSRRGVHAVLVPSAILASQSGRSGSARTDLLKVDNFLEKGAERLRANAGPWPTFTNPVKKVSRPAIAAGLKTASEGAKNRWKGDAYRLQGVSLYEDDWLIRDQTGIRRLKAIECSKMMGLNSWPLQKGTKVRLTEDENGPSLWETCSQSWWLPAYSVAFFQRLSPITVTSPRPSGKLGAWWKSWMKKQLRSIDPDCLGCRPSCWPARCTLSCAGRWSGAVLDDGRSFC